MRGYVWAPTFFVHAKFEVKNFSEIFHLQSTLDSEFFRGGVKAPTFFGHTKFFGIFFLQSTLDSELFSGGGLGMTFFWLT